MEFLKPLELMRSRPRTDRVVLNSIINNEDVLFGTQALNRRLPVAFHTPPGDWDILTRRNPRNRAREIERELDRELGGDFFFTKPAIHPGTHKVMSVGPDLLRDTEDDKVIADVSRLKRNTTFNKVRGVNTITKGQIIKNRKAAIRNPEASFRREKDLGVLNLIKGSRRLEKFGFI